MNSCVSFSFRILILILDLNTSVATSPNGCTDDFIGAEWFEKSFIPQATARNVSGKPILLIVDGHSSHEMSRILELAELHNIIILCLPPHTTHKLQPLDVGVFGPLQRAWVERCDCVVELTGSEMRKEDFVNEYMDVREASFRSSTIVSAFKKSGTWPINRAVFTNDDFAPSVPYSTEAHNFPSLPDDSDPSDSDSDSDDSNAESSPQAHRQNCSPPPQSSPLPTSEESQSSTPQSELPMLLSSPAAEQSQGSMPSPTSTTDVPSAATGSLTPSGPIPPQQFYHDPILFDRIQQLEKEVQRLSGHVKMVELELQNEKRKSNERDSRGSKRRKLNVEARVLTSAEGKRLAAEKDAERIAKAQKRRKRRDNGRRKRSQGINNAKHAPPMNLS